MAIELTHVIQAPAESLAAQINAYLASLVPGDDADPEDPVYECTGISVVAPYGGLPVALLSLSQKTAESDVTPDDGGNDGGNDGGEGTPDDPPADGGEGD